MTTELERRFSGKMVEIYRRAYDEAGYNAARYLQMLSEYGSVDTAKMLINSEHPAEGYTKLYFANRLDITVEALVAENPEFHLLFEPLEIERAKKRLAEYEYYVE